MGKQYAALNTELIQFIEQQPVFFVATAMSSGHINLSPKGLDTLRILDEQRLIWLNLTGSGNETATHVQQDGRMTLMFNAFTGPPLILRLYGRAEVYHSYDDDWSKLIHHFPSLPGARQIFKLYIELVQTSCGMGVPLFDYRGQRSELIQWADRKGKKGIRQYWQDRNRLSLDGLETQIMG